METIKIREDNKKIYKLIYIMLGIYSCIVFYLNIMNVQSLPLLYSLFASTSLILVLLIVLGIIKRKRNIVEINYQHSQLLFYQSTYKNNKKLKLLTILFDVLGIISLTSLTLYFYIKMDFIRVYDIYGLIALGAVLLFLIFILVKDIVKYNQIDRVEVSNSIFNIYSYDKKFLAGFTMLLVAAFNIGILSFNIPHFKVYWSDLLIFEIIALISTIIYLLGLFISSKYYSYYTFKKIDEILMDTEILECIGKGTLASVYKAYVPSLDKIFAVKKLDSTEPEDIQAFENEFKLMKSLENQNLLSVYSYNEIKLEYIMDYMDYSLYEYMESHALTNEERIALINQLLDGMEYLHNHKILHRDLSIGNIMIKMINDNEYILKITDFGLAKTKGQLKVTGTKTERRLESTYEDPASNYRYYTEQGDIYGIGCLINYIYYGTTTIQTKDDYISKIITKCMITDLSQRYKSVNEVREDLNKGELN